MPFPTERKDLLLTAAGCAALADHVYFRPGEDVPAGWTVVRTSEEMYPGARDFFAALYRRNDAPAGESAAGESTYVIAFRGTNNLYDLPANVSIFFGRMPRQIDKAAAFVRHACAAENISPADVDLTGHSMGGYLAHAAGWITDARRVWTFNSPLPSPAARKYIAQAAVRKNRRAADGVLHIRSRHDIVSLWGNDAKNILEICTDDQHHRMKSLYAGLLASAGFAAETPHHHVQSALVASFNTLAKKLTSSDVFIKKLRHVFDGQRKPKSADKAKRRRAHDGRTPPR